jgi:hypothetical protein
MLLCGAALVFSPLAGRADQTVTSTEMLIRLNVPPMPASKPALRYALLPELKEMTPGNPIPNYLKCFMEQDFSLNREGLGRAALRQADRAARMDRPDWQILLKVKTDGIGLLLPDVQKLRSLAAALQERFRGEVALRHFNEALGTAKTMFAISRHMGEHPTLIGDLVGIAIAFVAIGPLEEMLEQPGCPNLYWALTNLPQPFVSLDRGMEGERLLIMAEFNDLDDSVPMNADQIQKVITHIDKVRDIEGKPRQADQGTRAWVNARIKDENRVLAARRRLIDAGIPAERLQRFPADQVILLDERCEYEVRRDEVMKLMKLPAWQFEALMAQPKPTQDPSLFDFLVPALQKVRRAQSRLEQRIALLRHVEALRLYAAEHEGKWPATLSDLAVPLPTDPFSGKPFLYTVAGGTAHLRGCPPLGDTKNPAYNVHYELTLQK